MRIISVVISVLFLVACGGSSEQSVPSRPEPPKPDLPDSGYPDKPNVVIIFTDDQGYADLGIQGSRQDLKTPNIDKLASLGTRFSHGYVTSPQCTPSRAGLVSGQYQQRFGVDENRFTPMPLDIDTIGSRFQRLGYKTGMIGKWHLEVMGNSSEWLEKNHPDFYASNQSIEKLPLQYKRPFFPDERGFDDVFWGYERRYWTNFELNGSDKSAGYQIKEQYRLDLTAQAAGAFIERNAENPFLLYFAPYGPHVPLEATEFYLSRIPENMPTRRRYALAMMAAIDDGVGMIVDKLEKHGLMDNTIIFFISDNGAPLGDDMTDAPLDKRGEAWNGSRNDPLIGEKGMLTDGGIRVPYLVKWQGHFPAGKVIDKPVSSLDAVYTALELAGEKSLSDLDGVSLLPALEGNADYLDERALYWRFWMQRAVRKGKWKYLQAGIRREFLFDMESQEGETLNVIDLHPAVADELRQQLLQWSNEMQRPDPIVEIPAPFGARYDHYLPPPQG
ncbi:sulfatase [Bowmanella yangjiangensis]|uniref:Sulfatase-like hydrolase/transferase n=1 Tax=Bowmanella yangjiangensis TaxID=2811230 RepID=A0ABS3CV24_9ALTE|nr:sulfatase-like hydrolase/transferase [Bowmanella yangjiangensis]MBN7820455.1 sulfatase-like hydrolase/transferase [Bowmanella yangjiangensis]